MRQQIARTRMALSRAFSPLAADEALRQPLTSPWANGIRKWVVLGIGFKQYLPRDRIVAGDVERACAIGCLWILNHVDLLDFSFRSRITRFRREKYWGGAFEIVIHRSISQNELQASGDELSREILDMRANRVRPLKTGIASDIPDELGPNL